MYVRLPRISKPSCGETRRVAVSRRSAVSAGSRKCLGYKGGVPVGVVTDGSDRGLLLVHSPQPVTVPGRAWLVIRELRIERLHPGLDVVPDQAHPLHAFDAPPGWFVRFPDLEALALARFKLGLGAQDDDSVHGV